MIEKKPNIFKMFYISLLCLLQYRNYSRRESHHKKKKKGKWYWHNGQTLRNLRAERRKMEIHTLHHETFGKKAF